MPRNKKTKLVFIRCDGDFHFGLGHIYRCIAVADELKKYANWKISFLVATGKEGSRLVKDAGYDLEVKPPAMDEEDWIESVVKKRMPEVLIFDIRTGLSQFAIQQWQTQDILIVAIDDFSQRHKACDIAFYPPVSQVQRLDWEGFKGELMAGWEWMPLRKHFTYRLTRKDNQKQRILVTMGGSDPVGMTLKVIQALDSLRGDFSVDVILGSGFRFKRELNAVLRRAFRHFNILRNVKNIAKFMRQADLAIASFGTTAYELAAVGTPAVYLCLTDDHEESAQAFVNAGMAVSLGVHNKVSEQDVAESVNALLNDKRQRLKMAKISLEKVDGRGAQRIAKIIKAKLEADSGNTDAFRLKRNNTEHEPQRKYY